MPELPEVEVVRRGLDEHLAGRLLAAVRVIDTRSLRRHAPGPQDFVDRLTGRKVDRIARRGKYLWWVLDDESSLVVHLGMSGQVLVSDEPATHRHARIEFQLDSGQFIQFQDQRIFGGMFLDEEDPPRAIAHIALDPLDPDFDDEAFSRRLRKRTSGVKRALLDQGLVSGIGNIYADEALWRTRLHYDRTCDRLRPARVRELLGHVRDVMNEALAQGGTSFDALYVNVNGDSGYFARHLAVYGREGGECQRCGSQVVREPFMNRSSYRCPRCQPKR